MSVKIITAVWDSPCNDSSTLLLMLAMADWCTDQAECWPSILKLAEKSRLSERSCRYLLRRLEDVGVIECLRGNGRSHPNRYIINLETLQTMQPLPPLQSSKETLQTLQPLPPLQSSKETLQTLQPLHGSEKTLQNATDKPCKMEHGTLIGRARGTVIEPSEEREDKKPPIYSEDRIDAPHVEKIEKSFDEVHTKAKEKKSVTSRRCPPDHLFDASIRLWAAKRYPDVDVDEAIEAMRDWEYKTARSDWDACLRTWIRNEAKRSTPANTQSHRSVTEKEYRTLRNAQELIKEMGDDESTGQRTFLSSSVRNGRTVL